MRLVLPGNHLQFAEWLRLVYGPGGGAGAPPARPVMREEDLCGLMAEDVVELHQVGTYWENRAWGSLRYLDFMSEGVLLGKHWAMEWDLDYRKAQAQRIPLGPEDFSDARAGLLRLEQELTDDA